MDIYSQRHGQKNWNGVPSKGLDWESTVDKFLDEYQPRGPGNPGIDLRRNNGGQASQGKSKRLFVFYLDAMKGRGYDVASAEEMMRLWVEAGCDEETMQQNVDKENPRTREELRLVIMKLFGRLRENQIPRTLNVGAMLDIAVDFFWGVGGRRGESAERQGRVGFSEMRGRGGTQTERQERDGFPEMRGRGSALTERLGRDDLSEMRRGGDVLAGQIRDGLSEMRGRGGAPTERQGRDVLSVEDRLESLVPLQQFVVNAMSNSFSNVVFVTKVSMFIQKMVSVAGYDLRSLHKLCAQEGTEPLRRTLGGKLIKYEAALPNGITIPGIVNMTIDFLCSREGDIAVNESRVQHQNNLPVFEPPPFFQGYSLPDVSRPPPPHMSVQDQAYRGVLVGNIQPGPPFMGGGFDRRNNYEGRNQNGSDGFQNKNQYGCDDGFQNINHNRSRGFESRSHYEAGHCDRELERRNNFDGNFRSRSPRNHGRGGGGDLRGKLPPKDVDKSVGKNKTLYSDKMGRKDLDKEMDEWRKEKERKAKNGEKEKSRERRFSGGRGGKEKNLQKSLDDELDELAKKRERVKKKNVTNKSDTDDVIEVTLDDDEPVKKKLSEDEDIDCITLD